MKPETTRVTARRLCIALLAALHVVAAPCVMAMSVPGGGEPCQHCDGAGKAAACATTAVDPASDVGAPAPGPNTHPDASRSVAFLMPRLTVGSTGLQPVTLSRASPFRTGRHAGDPPLNLFFGRLLI